MNLRTASMLAALAFAATGCMAPTPHIDRHLGETVNLLKAQQTLNPEAARNTDPVSGLDGRAAKSGYDQYQRSFIVREPQPNPFVIGIGGGVR